MKAFVITVLLASPALASECPEAPDHSVRLAELVEEVRDAKNEMYAARIIGSSMRINKNSKHGNAG